MVVSEHIDSLITDFLADSISREDYEVLMKWVNSDPENRIYFEVVQDAWIAAGNNSVKYDANIAFAKFNNRRSRLINRRRTFLWAAAAIAAIILSTFLGFYSGKKDTINNLADIVIETPAGTRTKIWLPDSTSIWLNSSSRITYSQSYGIKERRVTLSGEGLFDVRHDINKPFTVISDGISVTDIGTRFDFRNYESDKESVISVLDGSVSLTGGQASDIVMNCNETIVIDKVSGQYKITKAEDNKYDDWTVGKLTFHNDMMSDIAAVLERAYSVKIIFADPEIANVRFWGSFTFQGESLSSVLDDFAGTGKLNYSISRDSVIIFKGNY